MNSMQEVRADLAQLLRSILPSDYTVREEADIRAHVSTQASVIRDLMGSPVQYAEIRYAGPGASRLALKAGVTRRTFSYVLDVWYAYDLEGGSQAAWDAIIEDDGGIIPTFAAQPRTNHARVEELQEPDPVVEALDPSVQMYAHRLTTLIIAKHPN